MRRAMLVILLCMVGGCGRSWYRRDADRDTYAAVEERNADPRWEVPYLSVNANPTSRLYDPYNPDFPPMPPDDPAAHEYMHWANGMPGYRRWHKDGDAPSVEDPAWRNYLELDDKGVLVLSRERAVELAWLNSREYQTALEQLYLQALTLTFDRFEFALHWFGTNNTNYVHFGAGADETSVLTTASTLGFTKMLGAGGQLGAELLNSFVFQFTPTGPTFAASNINFSFLQPLLRLAGRDVRMETLTQGERTVLYFLRDFAHFRKNFYFNVTTSRFGSFLALLQQVQSIRNLEANVEKQQQNLLQHQALYETEQVSSVQLDQAIQGVLTDRLSLLQAQTALQTAFDGFKAILGLPPDIPIRLDDSLLGPFQLADPALERLQKEVKTFLLEYRNLLDQAPPLAKLQEGFRKLKDFQASTLKLVSEVQGEIERWKKLPAEPGQEEEETSRQRALQESLAKQIPELRKDLQTLGQRIDQSVAALREDKRKQGLDSLLKLIEQQSDTVAALFVLQNRVRVHLIQLQPVNWPLDAAVEYARTHRLDLMNERGRVVDAWRQIAVTANALKSDLNLTLNANIATPLTSNNPVAFSATANTYSAGLQFNAPLNREAERNIYRQSLINYQAERRTYMSLDDQIQRSIRLDLRQLETDRLSFDIARRSLVTAARQVESAEYNLRLTAGQQAQQTTVTIDVLNAYTALLSAKNSLIGTWVSYEQDRIQLLLDLEALQLDEREVSTNDSDGQSHEPVPSYDDPRPNDGRRPDDLPLQQPAGQAVP